MSRFHNRVAKLRALALHARGRTQTGTLLTLMISVGAILALEVSNLFVAHP
jgi:hypothetical protein